MLHFDNSYVNTLPHALWRRQAPTPLRQPHLISLNHKLIKTLGLTASWWASQEALDVLAGHQTLSGSDPVAMKYGGHQFGGWNPDLGDGRGLLLGEIIDNAKQRWDLHLKGSGPTPFSRMGDGRAVLRSSIREYLAGEALHHLGVPTTRALALVGSREPVRRERMETGATLLRIADSHIRFGHFEWLSHSGHINELKQLADYVIQRHYPDCATEKEPYVAFFTAVVKRTATLMADWQRVGFAHGVMNTDNFSITGATLDFGPYGFLDRYDPYLICNHSDHNGRYAWYLQPSVGFWNLNALAHALAPIIPVPALKQSLAEYEPTLTAHYDQGMNARLGLAQTQEIDRALVQGWLSLLQVAKADFTLSFRWLSTNTFDVLLADTRRWGEQADTAISWLAQYQQRCLAEGLSEAERLQRMQSQNPIYVLRNYLAEQVIQAAEQGQYEPLERLLSALQSPFTEQSEYADLAEPPPAWGQCLSISCSS
ncbi:MAG: YdiU family protein [Moraxellaceae bacterium]|nr:YdiU family protein [Moraxellaceae bacterium]